MMNTHLKNLSAQRLISWRAPRACCSDALSVGFRLSMLLTFFAAGRLMAFDGPSAQSVDTNQATANRSEEYSAKPPATGSNFSAANSQSMMRALDDKHGLAINDQISFRIVEDGDDPKTLTVMDSGELEVPYIGRFQAAGKTCKDLASQLKTELEKDYYYHATVIIAVNVMAKSRGKVYLVGPVHVPGPQDIPSDEVLTLSKAILRAGGFTDFADKKNVKVTRQAKVPGGKDEVFVINVGKVLEQGTTESDLPLEPGDLIYVAEKLVRF